LEYVTALLLGIVGSLVAWEISLRYRKWCEAIIRSAVFRLPEDQRTIREEEWLSALNDHIGLVSSFAHAIGCWIGAPAVAAGSKRPVPATKRIPKRIIVQVEGSVEAKLIQMLLRNTMKSISAEAYFSLRNLMIEIVKDATLLAKILARIIGLFR
jgi:hypothetical protein